MNEWRMGLFGVLLLCQEIIVSTGINDDEQSMASQRGDDDGREGTDSDDPIPVSTVRTWCEPPRSFLVFSFPPLVARRPKRSEDRRFEREPILFTAAFFGVPSSTTSFLYSLS